MFARIAKSLKSIPQAIRILKSGGMPKDNSSFRDVGGEQTTGELKLLNDDPEGYYQAYRRIVWLRRCVDLRAANCASVPLKLYRVNPKKISKSIMKQRAHIKKLLEISHSEGHEGKSLIEKRLMEKMELVDEHAVVNILSDVNPFSMNRSDLWRNTEQNMGIYGEAFWLLDGVGTNVPREIYMLPNKAVTVVPGDRPQELIKHYEYKPKEDADPIIYPTGNIIHFKYNDPDNPISGLSPLSSVMPNVNSYLAASRWNYVFFKNAIKPVGFIELPPEEDVDDETIVMIREAIEAVHQGVEKTAKVVVLSGGAKWKEWSSAKAKDSDWRGLQKDNQEAFTAAEGTPLFLVSSHDAAHFATAKQAEESFWTDTIIPELRWFEEVLFWSFLPLFPDTQGMVLRFDLSEVPALERINSSKMERVQKATGVATKTPNEGRKMLGDPPLGSEGDKLYGLANQVPLFEIEENEHDHDAEKPEKKTPPVLQEVKVPHKSGA